MVLTSKTMEAGLEVIEEGTEEEVDGMAITGQYAKYVEKQAMQP